MLKRLFLLLILAGLLVPSVGCCRIALPRRGFTVRGGLDFREHKKPLGFVELIDTEWDEMRRTGEQSWLENSGFDASGSSEDSCNTPDYVPAENDAEPPMPELGEPSDVERISPPVPPVPPEPGLGPESEAQKPLPTTYSDEDDYERILELASYEQRRPQSLANRAMSVKPTGRRTQKKTRRKNWLWSKP